MEASEFPVFILTLTTIPVQTTCALPPGYDRSLLDIIDTTLDSSKKQKLPQLMDVYKTSFDRYSQYSPEQGQLNIA